MLENRILKCTGILSFILLFSCALKPKYNPIMQRITDNLKYQDSSNIEKVLEQVGPQLDKTNQFIYTDSCNITRMIFKYKGHYHDGIINDEIKTCKN